MRPLMIINGFRYVAANPLAGASRRERRVGRRARGKPPRAASGHVLSETAGARGSFGSRRLILSRGAGLKRASIDGEDRFTSGGA